MLRNAIVDSSLKNIQMYLMVQTLHNKLLKKKNMMHPCRNIFKRPFFAIKLFKKCDWISRVCFYVPSSFLSYFKTFCSTSVQWMTLLVIWIEKGWTHSNSIKHFRSAAQWSTALFGSRQTIGFVFCMSWIGYRGSARDHHGFAQRKK